MTDPIQVLEENTTKINQSKQRILQLETALNRERDALQRLEEIQEQLTGDASQEEARVKALHELEDRCVALAEGSEQSTEELTYLLSQQPLATLNEDEMLYVWWRTDLSLVRMSGVTGETLMEKMHQPTFGTEYGLSPQEVGRLRFMTPILSMPG